MKYNYLLSIVARFHPQALDAIIPHGPVIRSGFDAVALNPQPLPPGPPPDAIQLGAGLMAREIVRLAIEEDLRGGEPARLVRELVDDWCATPWPRRWPFPVPGPRPEEGPFPDPWRLDAARVIGAIVFADHASRLGEGDLRKVLEEGAERLVETAVHG